MSESQAPGTSCAPAGQEINKGLWFQVWVSSGEGFRTSRLGFRFRAQVQGLEVRIQQTKEVLDQYSAII